MTRGVRHLSSWSRNAYNQQHIGADVLEYCPVPTKNSSEARVVYSLKQHLLSEGLRGGRVSEVIVDADGAYQASPHAKALEPMATIWIDGFRPDLVCSVRQESCSMVAGFEVKADIGDWPKGLTQARDSGIGVLMLEGAHWHEAIPPADPRPLPAKLQVTSLALEGVPAARKLQLNHPLNYLVVPYLRLLDGQTALISLMEEHWPDLRAVTSRRYAIAVNLVVETLRRVSNGSLKISELLDAAAHRDGISIQADPLARRGSGKQS